MGYLAQGEERALRNAAIGGYKKDCNLVNEKGSQQKPGRRSRSGKARGRGQCTGAYPGFRRHTGLEGNGSTIRKF